jgi:type II secretory pathway pseudopilin PulG
MDTNTHEYSAFGSGVSGHALCHTTQASAASFSIRVHACPFVVRSYSHARRSEAGFTLAEVLAALLFMAIVIPVAIEGLHIANRAGEVGQRKNIAARVAERVLNELRVTGQWPSGGQSGIVQEGTQQYRWTGTVQPWPEDTMQVATVEVVFPVEGHDYNLSLSTLVDKTLP